VHNQQQQQQQPGSSSAFAVSGGHSQAMLAFAAAHAARFARATAALTGDLACCGWCGCVALGGKHSMLRRNMRARAHDGLPPAALANPWAMQLMCPPEAEDALPAAAGPAPPERYWACSSCQAPTLLGQICGRFDCTACTRTSCSSS
jgi:hypothetical protein